MSYTTEPLTDRKRLPVLLKAGIERRKKILLWAQGSIDTEAKTLAKRDFSGGLSPSTKDIFISTRESGGYSSLPIKGPPYNPILKGRQKDLAIDRVTHRILLTSISPNSPSPLRQNFTPNSPSPRSPSPELAPLFQFSDNLPRIIITTATPSSSPSPPTTPTPMERRRGTLPVGNSFPNSVPNFFQQQTSFGSTDSADSNDSFQTQIPLPFHLPQDHPYNNDYALGISGFAPYGTQARSTGSNGTKSLNPTSSPYIPQGNTPILPSAGMSGQGWGAPYMGGQNGQMASSYQQHGQQMGSMQYQNGAQYQQPQMQLGGPVGRMNSQAQSQFGNNMGPYGHFGAVGVTQSNLNQYNNTSSQIESFPFATPETAYATTAAPTQSFSMQYIPGVVTQQPVNQMYNGHASSMYQNHNNGNSSFQSNPSTMYSSQMPGGSSFDSASTNIYTNQTANTSFKSAMNKQLSRPGSTQSHASSMRDQKKPFDSFAGKERNNSYRDNGNQRSTDSSTPTFGGPVQGVRGLSPEKLVSQSNTPEPSRTRKNKNKIIEDTSAVPTPVSKPHPSDTEFTSEQRRTQSQTPQLRSRRGQTIASASVTVRKQSVSSWAAEVKNSSDPGAVTDEDMKRRGSPVKAMSKSMTMVAMNEADPFMSSAVNSHLFDCMTVGPFNGNFATQGPFSNELLALTAGGRSNPSLAKAIDPHNVPFAEYCRFAKPDNWGVIKVKNIPYGVTRAEVLAFLGRNARIISESEFEPIHIVMERVTSKTLDCFVEFLNLGEAVSAVNRFETNRMGGRGGRLGQRHVEVELSTQGALLKELFPKAKNVRWESSRPQIIERDPHDPYNSGFQGFVTKEELVMMVKHVETPQRSPFSKDCPQRPFECLISTLVKYPWYMVEHITIEDRNMLHEATKTLLALLVQRVNSHEDQNVNMNSMLLKRVWRAALRCPGFTPSMKDDIVYIAGLNDQTAIEYGLAPHASFWNKLWCIGPKPHVPVDVILWYIGKIRQACVTTNQLSLAEQAEKGEEPNEMKLFGDLNKYINYGPDLNNMSLASVAKIEWTAIENALRRAFTNALPPPN